MTPKQIIRDAIIANDGPDDILESLKAAGYVVVPKDPNEAMRDAGAQAESENFGPINVWSSMVEAAQQ